MADAGARRPFFRRRKSCPFTGANAPKIDYKDSKLLMRYVSERGKIVPSGLLCGPALGMLSHFRPVQLQRLPACRHTLPSIPGPPQITQRSLRQWRQALQLPA